MKYWLAIFVTAFFAGCSRDPDPSAAPGAEAPDAAVAAAREDGAAPSTMEPFFEMRADESDGRVYVTLPAPGDDGVMLRAIHSSGLTAGLGSNPVGLDRGLADEGRILAFRKIGPRVVIEQENWGYRASADNPLEKASVAQSFARSFLWSGDVVEATEDEVVVDISGFLTTDVLDVRGALRQAEQGDYAIDGERSFPDLDSVLVFPDNVEVDAFVTLTLDEAGGEVAATAADGRVFTLVAHHSFVRLPAPGFRPREFDPRSGAIDVPYYDFSAALDEPIVRRFARRFRLQKATPGAAKSAARKPIVFYVDSGAPAPVRSALIDGASWWADAFEAAGFENAYEVQVLPDGAHPLDVRYNTIQWVHRQTRGWSYGGGVHDPRTGEMLKANVILGSQRVRQDRMIFEGLAGAEKTGTGADDDPVVLALARIRQLAAHEVGHTLGFAHNFAASTNDRASVMDYPAPYVRPTADGALDFSAAYGVGVGAWDKIAARWLYAEFADGADEKAALNKIITDAYASGLRFVDDAQGRPVSGAHPAASVWDNGADPVSTLNETMRVREIALSNFGVRSLKKGAPTSDLRRVIAPIYLYHRYQVAAAAKLIGGYDFRYALKGDGPFAGAPVAGDRQRAALTALAGTLDPGVLDLPDAVMNLLNPRIQSFDGDPPEEVFASDQGAMFDLLSAADGAGSVTLGALLHPQRIARLIEQERRGTGAPAYEEVLAVIDARLFSGAYSARDAEISRRLQARYVSILMENAEQPASPAVAARTDAHLRNLRQRLQPGLFPSSDVAARAHRAWLAARIDAHLDRPAPAAAPAVAGADIPPGSPIGSGAREDCWFCELD